jgi:hypothetical protein
MAETDDALTLEQIEEPSSAREAAWAADGTARSPAAAMPIITAAAREGRHVKRAGRLEEVLSVMKLLVRWLWQNAELWLTIQAL